MRALVVSDIHGRLEAIRWLRSAEPNRFDAVIVAGDLLGFDKSRASEILETLASFDCPVAFIRGNWDAAISAPFAAHCHHVQLQPLAIESWSIIGIDDVGPWQSGSFDGDRKRLAEMIREIGSVRCIVVSHDRLPFATRDMQGVPLFVFGHRHKFTHTGSRGSTFLDPGALGEVVTVTRNGEWVHESEIRNAIVGSYAIAELGDEGEVHVARKSFQQYLPGWKPLEGWKWPGAPILDAPFIRT
jgi:predicted phosphodiesterase